LFTLKRNKEANYIVDEGIKDGQRIMAFVILPPLIVYQARQPIIMPEVERKMLIWGKIVVYFLCFIL